MNPIATTNQKSIATTKPMKSVALYIASSLVMTGAAQANLPATADLSFQLNLGDDVTILSYKVGEVETPFGKELFLGAKTSLSILVDGNVTITTGGEKLEGPVSLLVKTSDGKNQEITIATFIGKPENLGIQVDQTYYTNGFKTAGGYVADKSEITGENLLSATFPSDKMHVMLTMPAAWAGYEAFDDKTVIEASGAIDHAAHGNVSAAARQETALHA